MSIYFIDTSSLAKRYVSETGSAWLSQLIEAKQGNVCVISELTSVEMISLIARAERERRVSSSVAGFMRIEFLTHCQNEYIIAPLHSRTIRSARQLVVKHSKAYLRTLDAIQLASAVASP